MSTNGYLRDDELTIVQGGIRLRNDAARQWFAMDAAAAKDGVNLSLVTSFNNAAGYRPWSVQLDMRARPALYNIGKGFGLPGLPSQHGFGTCVDIATGLAWIINNGARFGFTRPLATTDPNHFRYDGITKTASLSATPIYISAEGIAMCYTIVPETDGGIYVVSLITGNQARIGSPYHVGLLNRVKANTGNDTMLGGEIAIVQGYLAAINPPTVVAVPALALTDAQIAAIGASVPTPTAPPTKFTITGEAHA